MPLHQRMPSSEQRWPGTALGSNSEEQGGRERLALGTYAGCCFCSPGHGVSNHSKEASSFSLFSPPLLGT